MMRSLIFFMFAFLTFSAFAEDDISAKIENFEGNFKGKCRFYWKGGGDVEEYETEASSIYNSDEEALVIRLANRRQFVFSRINKPLELIKVDEYTCSTHSRVTTLVGNELTELRSKRSCFLNIRLESNKLTAKLDADNNLQISDKGTYVNAKCDFSRL